MIKHLDWRVISILPERSCCWLFYKLVSSLSCRRIIRLFERIRPLRWFITSPSAKLLVFAFLSIRAAILGFSMGKACSILYVCGRVFSILWTKPREIMGSGFSSNGRSLASEGRIESKHLEESIFLRHLKGSTHCSSFLWWDCSNLFHFHKGS